MASLESRFSKDKILLTLILLKKYFDLIKTRQKTVEGRINSSAFNNVKPGAKITFICKDTQEKLVCSVKYVNYYPNFKSMLQKEGLENMLPGIETLQKGVDIYEGFPGYKEKVKQVGAIAIGIDVIFSI